MSLFILPLLSRTAAGLDNGVARTPPMGWNPYNAYASVLPCFQLFIIDLNVYVHHRCTTDEDLYHASAFALVQLGLRDLGYKYLNLCVPSSNISQCVLHHTAHRDCGWQATSRTQSGTFRWDTTHIPSGIPALADYVHGLGLQFGLYSDACVNLSLLDLGVTDALILSGYYSCDTDGGVDHRIGSLGYEQSDAKTFAEWGADYLKVSQCVAHMKLTGPFSMIIVLQ